MDSKIGFEMSLFVVEAIRGRCASFMILTATVWEISGGQTNSSIFNYRFYNKKVDTFQSLEISLERRAFGYIMHPSSDRSVYPSEAM